MLELVKPIESGHDAQILKALSGEVESRQFIGSSGADASLLKLILDNPEIRATIAGWFAKLIGGGSAPVPSPLPAPPKGAPLELVYPDACEVRVGSLDDRNGEPVAYTLGGDGEIKPVGTSSLDDRCVIRLEPFWSKDGEGVLIAEADDDEGPNPHLRWRQRVVSEYAGFSRVVEGGLGRPDDEQNTDERSFVRVKRYNETRGQVIPVRLGAKGGPYRMWVEMDTPSGVVKSNVITVREVR